VCHSSRRATKEGKKGTGVQTAKPSSAYRGPGGSARADKWAWGGKGGDQVTIGLPKQDWVGRRGEAFRGGTSTMEKRVKKRGFDAGVSKLGFIGGLGGV